MSCSADDPIIGTPSTPSATILRLQSPTMPRNRAQPQVASAESRRFDVLYHNPHEVDFPRLNRRHAVSRSSERPGSLGQVSNPSPYLCGIKCTWKCITDCVP